MNNKKTSAPKTVLMYVILILVFVILFLALKWFYDTRTETAYTRPTTPVEVTEPGIRTVEKTITLSSTVSADSTIAVTPYVDGTIIEYLVTEGDYVKEGDVIARIDPEPYRLQKEQAQAAYDAYETSFERVEKLYASNAVSQQDYDTTKAQRDAYKATLELAELQLSYTDVVAHASGTVLKTVSSQGSTAVSGTPIAVIADLSNLVVNLDLGEKYYSLFTSENASNIKITVTKPSSDYTEEAVTTAHIKALSPYIDSSSRNFKLYLTLDDPSQFRPGMYVKVSLTIETREGWTIERSALKLDGSAYYVDMQSLTAEYVDLSSAFMNDEWVLLPEGYEDKAFIIKGQSSLFSGENVNIVEN
jgi:membrane fusion protein, multidrug efflux system